MATIPFVYLCVLLGGAETDQSSNWLAILTLVRLLRLVRLVSLSKVRTKGPAPMHSCIDANW